jgi:uncharacterized cupin superfamily protein
MSSRSRFAAGAIVLIIGWWSDQTVVYSRPLLRSLQRGSSMPLRKINVGDVTPFEYEFEPPIKARMADIGRALGSAAIGLVIQTVKPGCRSSRRHRHVFQEEFLVVMAGSGTLHHGDEPLPVRPGDVVCYLPGDAEPHAFENTGSEDLVVWAFGNRFRHEVCIYPDQGLAFVEGLGADVPLASMVTSQWTEERRQR